MKESDAKKSGTPTGVPLFLETLPGSGEANRILTTSEPPDSLETHKKETNREDWFLFLEAR